MRDGAPGVELLRVAQQRKIDRLLDLTGVGPGTRLLEIGSGWGELARRAAGRGAKVRTITLSERQLAYTRRQADGRPVRRGGGGAARLPGHRPASTTRC